MLLNSGQACGYPMKSTHAKYGGFAYSSAFGYSVPSSCFTLEQYSLASQLGFSDDGGEYWKTRRLCEYAGLESRKNDKGQETHVLVSVWKPYKDVKVKTILVPSQEDTPNWHLRVHKIEAGREVMTADGSFAIANESGANVDVGSEKGRNLSSYDAAKHEGTFPVLIGNYDLKVPEGWATGREGAFAVSKGCVGIRALEGELLGKGVDERSANIVNADPNTNLLESRTVIPTLQHTIPAGSVVCYISAVYAKPAGADVQPSTYLDGWDKPPSVPEWLLQELKSA